MIGEVVYFHLVESILAGGRVDFAELDASARLGGPSYTRVTPESMFSLARPAPPGR